MDTCGICYSEFSRETLTQCESCLTLNCNDCLREYWNDLIVRSHHQQPICPNFECRAAPAPQVIQRVLTRNTLITMETRNLHQDIRNSSPSSLDNNDLTFTNKKRQRRDIENKGSSTFENTSINHKESIGTLFKSQCWKLLHTRKCPNCKVHIENISVCGHMECARCGYEFCWSCRQHLDCDSYGGYICPCDRFKIKIYKFFLNVIACGCAS